MKITFDSEARAAYIYLKSNEKVVHTVPLLGDEASNIQIDLDASGAPVGIEILGVDRVELSDITATGAR